jgi:CIC family chloride channel protein
MAALCLVKIVATIVSYASGNAGGIFAPSLFIGAMAGGAVGIVVQGLVPFPTGGAGAYALVGMGAAFAGIIRAPMTSVFMIFEITQDYQIIVPLMVANMLSFAISRRLQRLPIYHALLRQDGIHLPEAAFRETGSATARDLMQPPDVVIAPAVTIDEARDRAVNESRDALIVGTSGRVTGVVTLEQLAGAAADGRGGAPVRTLVDGTLTHAHADHPIDVVLERFADGPGVLPVVGRDDAARLEGVITLEAITRYARRRRNGPAPRTE